MGELLFVGEVLRVVLAGDLCLVVLGEVITLVVVFIKVVVALVQRTVEVVFTVD